MPCILDTNIVSEFLKPHANSGVIFWAQDNYDALHLTTITIMELYYGAVRLPDGKRKQDLIASLDAIVRDCSGRIFDFDDFSAYLCATIRCEAEAIGRPSQLSDAMIAAICMRNDATLVTHNTKDFEHCAIDLIDPFDYESETLKELRRREAER